MMRARAAAAAALVALLAVLLACMPAAEAADLRALLQTAPKAIVPGKNCNPGKKPSGAPAIRRISPGPLGDTGFWTWRVPKPLPARGGNVARQLGCITGLEYQVEKIQGGVKTVVQGWTTPPGPGLNSPTVVSYENPESSRIQYRISFRWVGNAGAGTRVSTNTRRLEANGGGT